MVRARNLLPLLLMLTLLLVACGGAAAPTSAPPAATQPPAPAAATQPPAPAATTAPSGGEGQITINFWHQESVDVRVKVLQTLLDKFHEQNPNITVIQNTMTWDEQFVKLMSAVKAGNPPELLWGTDQTTVTMAATGALVPVTDIVKALDSQYGYVAAHRDALNWDNEYWGVPIFGLSYNFWYRKDLFKEAGLEAPKTWDEMLAAAKKLNAPSSQKWGTVFPASGTLYADQVVASFLFSNGGDIMGFVDGHAKWLRWTEVYQNFSALYGGTPY